MRLTTLASETDIGALADRLYDLGCDPQLRRQAETALLAANPQLTRIAAFRPGVMVTLPDMPELRLRSEAVGLDPVDDTFALLKRAVADYGDALLERSEAARRNVDRQREILKAIVESGAVDSKAALVHSLQTFLKEREAAITGDATEQLRKTFEQIASDLGG
jgi:hypothetical protein